MSIATPKCGSSNRATRIWRFRLRSPASGGSKTLGGRSSCHPRRIVARVNLGYSGGLLFNGHTADDYWRGCNSRIAARISIFPIYEDPPEALKNGSSRPMPKMACGKMGFRRTGTQAGSRYDLQNVQRRSGTIPQETGGGGRIALFKSSKKLKGPERQVGGTRQLPSGSTRRECLIIFGPV